MIKMPMRLFVEMELCDRRYLGCVFISDVVFCRQIHSLLQSKKGLGIKDIGDLDVSHMLFRAASNSDPLSRM